MTQGFPLVRDPQSGVHPGTLRESTGTPGSWKNIGDRR